MAPRVRRRLLITIVALFGSCAVFLIVQLVRPHEDSYEFVTASHPISMWGEGQSKWAYYSLGGDTDKVADSARKELLARGYSEDKSKKPWFRFLKGDVEVIVCNHDEFAVDGTGFTGGRLTKGRSPSGTNEWPCVLVKNGPGTDVSLPLFQVKKLLLRW